MLTLQFSLQISKKLLKTLYKHKVLIIKLLVGEGKDAITTMQPLFPAVLFIGRSSTFVLSLKNCIMKKIIIAICTICALVSCEKRDIIQLGESDHVEDSLFQFDGLNIKNDSKTIPIEIALENLQKIKSELYSETKSDSGDILNIEVFGNLGKIPQILHYLTLFFI